MADRQRIEQAYAQGAPFSPQGALADNISETAAIIPVTDVSAFPDAPNYATIGTDEEGGTVLYAAKTDTALSGCTRGVEGRARAWQAGITIARNFTCKDFDALQEGARELYQSIQKLEGNLGRLFVVGGTEPESGPVLWFDTSGRKGSEGKGPA